MNEIWYNSKERTLYINNPTQKERDMIELTLVAMTEYRTLRTQEEVDDVCEAVQIQEDDKKLDCIELSSYLARMSKRRFFCGAKHAVYKWWLKDGIYEKRQR